VEYITVMASCRFLSLTVGSSATWRLMPKTDWAHGFCSVTAKLMSRSDVMTKSGLPEDLIKRSSSARFCALLAEAKDDE